MGDPRSPVRRTVCRRTWGEADGGMRAPNRRPGDLPSPNPTAHLAGVPVGIPDRVQSDHPAPLHRYRRPSAITITTLCVLAGGSVAVATSAAAAATPAAAPTVSVTVRRLPVGPRRPCARPAWRPAGCRPTRSSATPPPPRSRPTARPSTVARRSPSPDRSAFGAAAVPVAQPVGHPPGRSVVPHGTLSRRRRCPPTARSASRYGRRPATPTGSATAAAAASPRSPPARWRSR